MIFAITLFAGSLLIRVAFLPMPGFPADQAQFAHWSLRCKSAGLPSIYEKLPDGSGRYGCNYPPVYVYVLRGLAGLQDAMAPVGSQLTPKTILSIWNETTDSSAAWAIVVQKIPAVIADCVLVALLYFWLAGRLTHNTALAISIVYALCPAVIHNSSIWGQVDAIPTLLMVLSLDAAQRRRFVAMSVWATLAVLTKAQAVILIPVWASMTWLAWKERPSDLGKMVAVASGLTIVLLLPFAGAYAGIWECYAGAAKYYPFTHLNAFSAWFLGRPLAEPHLDVNLTQWYARDNVPSLLGLSPRTLGILGVLLLWWRVYLEMIRNKCDAATMRWAIHVLPLGFFVLSTQMHERYLFPAMALWVWAAVPTGRWWFGWLAILLCATLNQFWAWPGPNHAEWAQSIGRLLHHESIGILCSLSLIVILTLSLIDWIGQRRELVDNCPEMSTADAS